ncbi:MAG: hypothetical protein ACTSYD_02875 [Candidatus Heimdallarchaeaceae archaeon]
MLEYQYSRINPLRFSKDEIEKRKNWRCEHRHNGMNHQSCFNKEHGIKERVAAFDIEAGALNADFDITLAWCLKTIGKNEYWYDHIIKKDLEDGIYDNRIIESLVETLWSYDRIVTHYGKARWFDVPFIRARYLWLKARGLYKGVDFPTYGMLWISDTYSMSKRSLKISSRRQNSVANIIQGKDIKTKIEKDFWMAIKYGNSKERNKAIKYIKEHNIKDCEQLEGNYLILLPFCREVRTSI